MKKIQNLIIAAATMVGINSAFAVQSYTDATGETFNSAGGTLDFVGAEVSNTTTDLILKLKLDGDINPLNTGGVDWGKFMVGIATTKSLGTTVGNGWARPINMTTPGSYGMDFWIGAWVDGGGGSQFWKYSDSAGAWSQLSGSANQQTGYHATGKSFLTYTLSMSTLGIGVGDTIYFDAYSSGGGGSDGAIDALANSAQTISAWGTTYTSSGSNLNSYTLIPEPSSTLLMGLGLASLAVLRRTRKNA